MQFGLDAFASLSDQLRTQMEDHGKVVQFSKSSPVMDYDDTLENFYIIFSGKVKIYQMNLSNNKEQTLYLMTRGDMVDTAILLDGKRHELMIDILEPGEALRIPIGKVREWMYDYPAFGEIVLKYVAKQLRQVEELATDLTLFDTQERLIKLILNNVERTEAGGKSILDNLSHTEIANLIGTVRHVVDRHIKQLKEEGILEAERRKITLKSIEKLLERVKTVV